MEISKHLFGERILALCCHGKVYAGVGCALIDVLSKKVLCRHQKSIRSISGYSEYVGCSSYDGTATILNFVTDSIIDSIEGPDTEIKGIAFHKNMIAICTRGRTVWILEDFEISKILDDHIQDVKGCSFYEDRLYSWSYDNSVKMYELFIDDHSWELTQSIDLGDIIWNIKFYKNKMIALLQSGEMVELVMNRGLWTKNKTYRISGYPIFCGCVFGEYLAVFVNRSSLVLFDDKLSIVKEYDPLCDDSDILCCSYSPQLNSIFCGGDDGIIYELKLNLPV